MTGAPDPDVPADAFRDEGPGAHLIRPACSIIVPVYNQWPLVPALLESLRAQALPQNEFEVILVDNGSAHYAPPESLPSNVRIVHCETPGSYAARNVGIQAARAKWLVFTDADCRPTSQWLMAGMERVRTHADENTLMAGGIRMVAENPERPSVYELYDLALGIPQERYVRRGYAVTANLFVPKRLFERVGAFEGGRFSGGDAEFCRRAVRNGANLELNQDAIVEHPARKDWTELANKARRVKGGQLTAGPVARRILWAVRTCLPPARAWGRAFTARELSLAQKFIVCLVQARIWGAECREMSRLLLVRQPPRR